MKFKCIFLGLSFVAIFNQAHSQNVGINSSGTAPDNSAMLDIVSSSKGLLIPRVSLLNITDAATIPTPATGLLVYNTNASITNGNGVGYYYNNGTSASPNWVKLYASNGKAWETAGNTGTTAGTNFIGTTDAVDFVTKTNNTERMRVTSTGSVGINNSNPSEYLDVTGNVKYSGALMPNNLPGSTGQILTSAGANNSNVWLGQGTSGQVLTSAGAGAAPTWAALGQTVIAVTSAANTVIVGNNSGTYTNGTGRGWTIGTWQDVSGLTITRTTPVGKKVTVSFSIDGYGNDYSYFAPQAVVFRLLRDGVQIGKSSVLSNESDFYYYYWNANFITNTSDGDGASHTYKVQYWMANTTASTERVFIEDRSLIVREIAP